MSMLIRNQRFASFTVAAWCVMFLALGAQPRAQESVRGKAETWGKLEVEIVDQATGQPVPARCYLTDPTNQSWSPVGAVNYVMPPERHFIAQRGFEISLPQREYTLRVERGAEYHPVTRRLEIRSGETRREKIELARWIDMNARGWYSGDLHNHRDWREMAQLLLAEDLNLAPTLTEWVWEDRMISTAPPAAVGHEAIRRVDATHVFSALDTEIERLRDGPGAIDLVGFATPVLIHFHGDLLSPPNSLFAEIAHQRGGYVDAEKITWRDVAALVALGHVDFAGIVHNHFNRHGVNTETDPWGMIPKDQPEYSTPAGMPLWAMAVYYRFLNCGFKLPVSAGSASGVMASPVGFNRVYVHMTEKFGYRAWFRALKAGRSFATNGPMLFLTVNGKEPGDSIPIATKAGKTTRRLKVHAETQSAGELDRLEIIWKGQVVKSATATEKTSTLSAHLEMDAKESGWFVARAFERPLERARFAHTSPVYVRVGQQRGIVREDAQFFLNWIDREIKFYEQLSGFHNDEDRQAMLVFFRKARAVYQRLAGGK